MLLYDDDFVWGSAGLGAMKHVDTLRARFGGLFRNRNSLNKPNNCSFSGFSHSRVAVKPS